MNQAFLELSGEIEDFRKGNAIQYRLQDILLTGILAIICNMDTYDDKSVDEMPDKTQILVRQTSDR